MSEAALNLVNSFTGLFEASDELWDVVRVDVAKSQLTISVVFSERIDQALLRDEESEVVAARNLRNGDLVAEGHLDWDRELLSIFGEGPREALAVISGSQGEVSARSDRSHLYVLF